MNSGQRAELHINQWLIRARWFFYVAVFGVVLIQQALSYTEFNYFVFLSLATSAVAQLFVVLLLINLILSGFCRYLLYRVENNDVEVSIHFLGAVQVVTDLIAIALIIILAGIAPSIYPVLFFIPIVESIILFNLAGPVAVAILSSLLVSILTIIAQAGTENLTVLQLLRSNESLFTLNNTITSSVMVSVVYLISGFFAAYIVTLVRERSDLLAREGTIIALSKMKADQFAQDIKHHERQMSAKELELAIAYNRLKKLDEARSKFVSVTTHQMRTPLAGIKWALSMILSGQLGPITNDQKEFLKRGFDSTEKLVQIVNELLSIDKIESGKFDYTFTTFDIIELIANITNEFVNQAKSKNIEIEFVRPPSKKLELEADYDKIKIVLENLIDNAIKYNTKGGHVWIGINDNLVNTADPKVEIVVADQGIGIAPEDKDKVFHKFFRAGNAVQTEPDGTGLGLFIARDVVEKHGGSIWCIDRSGGGTEFHITLPIHQKKV